MPRKYLGDYLCIITKNKKASKHNNGVIIFSHGEQDPTGGTFTLQGGTVYFYCPDGASVLTNMYDFLKSWAGNKAYSHLVANPTAKCKDYILSKSVGYHQSDLAEQLGKKGIAKLIKKDPGTAEDENRHSYKVIEKIVASGNCPYDVVSIRNRSKAPEVNFSYVVEKLKKEGYGYGEFHCAFCRSDDNARAWDVETGMYADEE